MTNPLFQNRTPEIAATQLAAALAYAAECELATVERLEMLKSASGYDKRRHRKISEELVQHCWELNVNPHEPNGRHCGRLADALVELDAKQKLQERDRPDPRHYADAYSMQLAVSEWENNRAQ